MTTTYPAQISARRLQNPWQTFWARAVEVNTVVIAVLPSGSILGINIKFILFLILAPIALRLLFLSSKRSWTRFLALLLVPWALFFWICIANANGIPIPLTLSQAKDLVAVITGAWFVSIYCSLAPENAMKFIRLILYTEIWISVFKLSLFSIATITGQDVTLLLNEIASFFKVALSVSNFESDTLERFELASDGLLPLCVFAVMALRVKLGLRVNKATFFNILLLAATFLTFSRYLWGFTILVLLLAYTCVRRERLHKVFFVVLLVFSLLSAGYTSKVISDRYSDKYAGSSDEARTDQATALQTFFFEKPLLGHGLGSYSTLLLRSEDVPYIYENQLGALAGQIGIVGCLCMLLLLVSYYFRAFVFTLSRTMYKVAIGIMVVFWIFGGVVNPQVITSQASLSYGMILAILLVDPSIRSKPGEQEVVAATV